MTRVGIVGATGYTGAELLRLLCPHPQAEVRAVTSRQAAGTPVTDMFPQLRGHLNLDFSDPSGAALNECDVVFMATPHGAAMKLAPELLQRGVKVIDLSADFRLRDPAVFAHWYGQPHGCPELLAEAVYGLPEFAGDEIRDARLIACPGCYPTAVQLGLKPLLEAGLVDAGDLIADCKSGVSGAGRELKLGSLYCEAADSFKAYAGGGHRHLPEIEQGLARYSAAPPKLVFQPHLVPMHRGIHATLYARTTGAADFQQLFEAAYRGQPFVDVMPAGSHPETRSVRGSNVCRIAIHRPPNSDWLVVLSVIDNLVKGAAGQAVQCYNLMLGLDQTTGLSAPALIP